MRRRLDRLAAFLSRWVLGVFFRRLEVVGRGRVPGGRPLVVVANHVNSLVDPLLILGTLPVRPRFLAKSTLWRMRPLKPLLALAGAVPVYRRGDPGVDPARNLETFSRCHEVLRHGGTVALFPEGLSHNEPDLAPLRTGAARILLEAEARFGPLGARVVPVGLVFDDKERFRSRALVQVGEPLDPQRELEVYRREPQEAVRALTGRIREALSAVTVGYGSWEEAALIARAADLFERPELDVPEDRRLAERASLHRAFVEGYGELARRFPERVAAAARSVAAYDRLLRAAGLSDAHVAARYPAPPVLGYLVRTVAVLTLVLPVALAGTLLNLLPYRLAGWIVRRAADTPDVRATYKLFPSLGLYPATWLAAAATAAGLAGLWAGAGVLLAGPLTGWVALGFHDRRRYLARESRAFLLLRLRRRLAEELRRRRREAFGQVSELVELYRSPPGDGRGGGGTPSPDPGPVR